MVQNIMSNKLCASRKFKPKKCKASLQIEAVTHLHKHITMDILEPLQETEHRNKYILVIGNYFTKCNGRMAYEKHGSYNSCRILVHEFICHFGVLEFLHTDPRWNFEAELSNGYAHFWESRRPGQPPIIPQSNGMMERPN